MLHILRFCRDSRYLILFALGLLGSVYAIAYASESQGASTIVTTYTSPNLISWEPQIGYVSASLSVSTPGGVVTRIFSAGEQPNFYTKGLADGSYTYELRFPEYRGAIAYVHSGSFRIAFGQIVDGSGSSADESEGSTRDQVILEDLIVNGNLCVGLDCVIDEVFDFDTLRLKQNNLRIKFEDTSGASNFPTVDWQITANDSEDGGLDRFSIEDITNGTIPFTVEGAAPSNSLYVTAAGHLGLGTATPAAPVHMKTDDNAQSDLAIFENTSILNPDVNIKLISGTEEWSIAINGASSRMELRRANVTALSIDGETLMVAASHGIISGGTIQHASDRNLKDSFAAIEAGEVLKKVLEIPITQWKFKTEDNDVRHIGPTSQDFMAAFGFGTDERYIDTVDADGVALAAIQGLNAKVEEQAETITALRWHSAQLQAILRSRDESFEARFALLEKAILREGARAPAASTD